MTAPVAALPDAATLAACESELWTRISYLLLLAPKLMALKAKLNDPALQDHPKRAEAERRYEAMKKRRVSAMQRIAALWEALPPEGREQFMAIGNDIADDTGGIAFANAIWTAAKEPDAGPGWKRCPF